MEGMEKDDQKIVDKSLIEIINFINLIATD